MRTRPLAAALLLALAPAAFPCSARAQAGAEDPMTTMARARFKEGVDYYDKGQYELARAAFLQAYALKKHPAVLLNLAWSSLKSGHTLEAYKFFQQFLAEGKEITDKQRNDANDGLAQSRTKLGLIQVQAAAGTDVTIDGDHAGTAPFADALPVEPGAHTVKFKGSDGTSDTQSVSVLAGQKAVARFGGGGGAVAAAPAPAAPAASGGPEASPAPASPNAPAAQENASQAPPAKETLESHAGALTPPANIVPAIVLGSIAVAGFIGAGVTLAIKQTAQNNANDVAAQIVSNGGGSTTCPGVGTKFASACSAYQSDNNDVNADATAGNIFLGVGVAAALGTVIYWVAANKEPSATASTTPVVTPMVGPKVGGLSLSASF